MREEIIVLDFGSQYNQLITRRIRELGVYSCLLPFDVNVEKLKEKNIKGIILSGGPKSVYDENAYRCDERIFDLGVPILGICYGMQFIANHFNGIVNSMDYKEYGRKEIEVIPSLLFKDTPCTQTVWMSHGDQVTTLPKGFIKTASTLSCPIAAMENIDKKIFAVQFHPEVKHTEYGEVLLNNFINICECKKDWTMDKLVEEKIAEIKDKVGNEKVLLGISGGVDSSVAAVLIHKAINDNLTCMFIDHGLLRKDEAKIVMERFQKFGIHVHLVDAKAYFLDLLKGVTDPEQKRKIIGKAFIDVFDKESAKLGTFKFLAQGTLYTDIIESGTKTAQTIKSHHNVGGLPKDLKFKLLEPLNTLFKDEVRKLGLSLGMDPSLIYRQPFPGPGLAIRIIGEITEEKLTIVKESDAILREEIAKANLDKSIWQYFTALLNNLTVGVMGDKRTYAYTIAIRAVTSVDGMTADFARIPYEVLEIISTRIVNEVKNVNRVMLDITSKPPGTIEYE